MCGLLQGPKRSDRAGRPARLRWGSVKFFSGRGTGFPARTSSTQHSIQEQPQQRPGGGLPDQERLRPSRRVDGRRRPANGRRRLVGRDVHRRPADLGPQDGGDRGRVLIDDAILRLESIGRTIEAHFGVPQDIEWCLAGGDPHIVQSRPITSLFPIPASPDGTTRVFISAGHMQMMTDPVRPLGMSIFELASMFPVDKLGGWMFVDITHDLTTCSGRKLVFAKLTLWTR